MESAQFRAVKFSNSMNIL